MERLSFDSFQKSLESSLADEDLADNIISKMKSIYAKEIKYKHETPECKQRHAKFLNALSPDDGDVRTLLCNRIEETTLQEIAIYLKSFSTLDAEHVAADLSKIKTGEFEPLYERLFEYFSMQLYSGIDKELDSTRYSDYDTKSEIANFLFYALLEMSIETIRLEQTLQLLNEFLKMLFEKVYEYDSRTLIEIFTDAVYHCKNNSEYPIEWLLSSAFSFTAKNHVISTSF